MYISDLFCVKNPQIGFGFFFFSLFLVIDSKRFLQFLVVEVGT